MCQGGHWKKAAMVSLQVPAIQAQPPSGSGSLLASILYKVRETPLIQKDRWLVSAPGLGRRKVLSVRSTMSSTGHPSLPWLFCSTPFPSSFINYIPLTNSNCGQLRPPNVKLCTRDSVSWQHSLES